MDDMKKLKVKGWIKTLTEHYKGYSVLLIDDKDCRELAELLKELVGDKIEAFTREDYE